MIKKDSSRCSVPWKSHNSQWTKRALRIASWPLCLALSSPLLSLLGRIKLSLFSVWVVVVVIYCRHILIINIIALHPRCSCWPL